MFIKEGFVEFDKALNLTNVYYLAYFHKALIYSNLDEIENQEKTLKFYDLSIENNKNFDKTYFYKGCLLMSMERYNEDIQIFIKCKELRKNEDVECKKKIEDGIEGINEKLNREYYQIHKIK